MAERFVLILDDAQHLRNQGLAILDYLLEHQPSNLGLVVSSRSRLPLRAIPRLKANRIATGLETTDLALTADELHALLTITRGAEIDPGGPHLATLTQGWQRRLSC
jgi:ATP/maltotriose-dependent transcriptional regulator MalT